MVESKVQEKFKRLVDLTIIAACTSGLAIVATYLGLLQNLEWSTFDFWSRMHLSESKDSRIVVVTISELDIKQLQQWPISDTNLSKILKKISQQQPRAIGLDLYRDFPIQPGVQELEEVFLSTPNLIGVEKVIGEAVAPPPILANKQQVALADLVIDNDRKIRKALLSIKAKNGEFKLGLATRLALMYLARENISLQPVENTSYRTLGKALFKPLKSNDGGYIHADTGGFQILLNFRGNASSFDQVSIHEVLRDKIPSDLMKDRLVLIGSTAPSLNDLFYTPHSPVSLHTWSFCSCQYSKSNY